MSWWKDLIRGLWQEHPVFRLVLGMCPTLAITNTAVNGLTMGLATSFVLVASSASISLLQNFIPPRVRIPSYIVIIATFVTAADYVLNAFWHHIYQVLSLYIPLIVVNCLILGRVEAFSAHHPVSRATIDALGYGAGFTWTLTLLGAIRELLGFGSLFGLPVLGESFEPWVIMIVPPGAFLTLGVMLGFYNLMEKRKNYRKRPKHFLNTPGKN